MAGIRTQPVPDCPDCDSPMVLRRPKPGQDWDPFWGCSQYRNGCRGTRNIDPKTGEPENDEIDRPLDDREHDYLEAYDTYRYGKND